MCIEGTVAFEKVRDLEERVATLEENFRFLTEEQLPDIKHQAERGDRAYWYFQPIG